MMPGVKQSTALHRVQRRHEMRMLLQRLVDLSTWIKGLLSRTSMSKLSWLFRMFSPKAKAETLFARAMEKAKNKNTQGALDDYSAVIRIEKAPSSLKSMALFNRALAYSANGQYVEAKEDIDAVLAAPHTPANVRAAAKAKQERMRKLAERRT